MATKKDLKYFMRSKDPEIVTVPGPDTIRDEEGNILPLEIKVLSQAEITKINDMYRTRTIATDKKGNPKLVHKTELPWTGWRCVDYFVSELAVIHFIKDEYNIPRPFLEEISKKTTINEVLEKTGADMIVSKSIRFMEDID